MTHRREPASFGDYFRLTPDLTGTFMSAYFDGVYTGVILYDIASKKMWRMQSDSHDNRFRPYWQIQNEITVPELYDTFYRKFVEMLSRTIEEENDKTTDN